MITLRPYRPDDAPALLALFRDTIRRVNSRDYGPQQVRAWASDEIDPAAWATRLTGRFAVVAEAGGVPAGFADLEPDGHIDRIFVSADCQGAGVGRALMGALLAEARRLGLARLFAEVSITARPFFEAHEFTLLAPQVVTRRGAEFVNYRMERMLAEPVNMPGSLGVQGDGLKPNDFGLFDMLGNALEWCQDSLMDYRPAEDGEPSEDIEDTTDIKDHLSRVFRGGSFISPTRRVRCAWRGWGAPSATILDVGFRPARTFR